MTPRHILDLMAVRATLKSGRTKDALEQLEAVLREVVATQLAMAPEKPVWMRRGT